MASKCAQRAGKHAAISLGIRQNLARGGHHSDIQDGIMTRHDPARYAVRADFLSRQAATASR
jgi:hypothetical protein